LRTKIPFADFDYREAHTSELLSMESVEPILYANRTTVFECSAIQFLFSEPYVLFQLITIEANGRERMGKLEEGARALNKGNDYVDNQF
jgi:hypothetical protein